MSKPDSASCPLCGKASAAALAPFCSARCRDVDLNRWLSGAYKVQTDEKPAETADPDTPH